MRRPIIRRCEATQWVRCLQTREELSGYFEVDGRAVPSDIDVLEHVLRRVGSRLVERTCTVVRKERHFE